MFKRISSKDIQNNLVAWQSNLTVILWGFFVYLSKYIVSSSVDIILVFAVTPCILYITVFQRLSVNTTSEAYDIRGFHK